MTDVSLSLMRLTHKAKARPLRWANPTVGVEPMGTVVDPNDLRVLLEELERRNVSAKENATEELAERILLAGMTNPSLNSNAGATVLADFARGVAEAFYAARAES